MAKHSIFRFYNFILLRVESALLSFALDGFASSFLLSSFFRVGLARQFFCLDFKTPLCRARTWNFEDLRLLDAAAA